MDQGFPGFLAQFDHSAGDLGKPQNDPESPHRMEMKWKWPEPPLRQQTGDEDEAESAIAQLALAGLPWRLHMSDSDPIRSRSAPLPKLGAMLVCDQVIKDETSKKSSVIGVFDRILAVAFPASHAKLTVYVSVTDAEGSYRLRLEMVRVHDEMTVGRGEADVTVNDRFSPAEWVFDLHGLVFEEVGAYEFRLWANERFVGSKSFSVVKLQGGSFHG
jgi:hypothetical protein